jgi:hypothetical protein
MTSGNDTFREECSAFSAPCGDSMVIGGRKKGWVGEVQESSRRFIEDICASFGEVSIMRLLTCREIADKKAESTSRVNSPQEHRLNADDVLHVGKLCLDYRYGMIFYTSFANREDWVSGWCGRNHK